MALNCVYFSLSNNAVNLVRRGFKPWYFSLSALFVMLMSTYITTTATQFFEKCIDLWKTQKMHLKILHRGKTMHKPNEYDETTTDNKICEHPSLQAECVWIRLILCTDCAE